jgi:arylsulfatase A-like enzyme
MALLILGAALAGALYGVSEAGAVLLSGQLWIRSAAPLLVSSLVAGALLSVVPGAILGRRIGGVGGSLTGGIIALWGLAGLLEIVTDPPPFQEPSWWVHSPVATVLLLASLVLAVESSRRLQRVAVGVALATLAVPFAAPLFGGASDRGTSERDSPNILFVTLDTTRADHIGAYGYAAIQTPMIDALANQGVLFEAAVSQAAVTGPSHTTLFTGLGTWSHGSLLNGIPVTDEAETMAERLRGRGYNTGAFVSAYVLEGELGFNRGFATYDDDFGMPKGGSKLLPWRVKNAAARRLNPDYVLERVGEHTVDDALDWLDQIDGPWFLWVHLFDPHGPYEPPPPFDTMYYTGDQGDPSHTSMEQVSGVASYLAPTLEGITDVDWVIAQYDGEISYVDKQVGRLLEAVGSETLVVVAGDHGESLGENGVWFNHGDDLSVAATHVPLLIRWAGRVPAGVRVPGPVELTDVLPTVYDLIDEPIPPEIDGRSLVPSFSGERIRDYARGVCFDRQANVAERESNAGRSTPPKWRMAGLRSTSHLYVHRDHTEFGDQYFRLQDPETNVISDEVSTPEGTEAIGIYRDIARALLEAGSEGVDRSAIELSDEERLRLEALGYIE